MSDINELMARDPLNHTDESISEMIEKYRSARHLWAKGLKKAKPAAKPKAPKIDGLADDSFTI